MIAKFNEDTNCVEVYANEYAENPKISICTPFVKDNLRTMMQSYSQLQLLLYDKSAEYAEMVFDGTMQDYLDLISVEYYEQSRTMRENFRKCSPDTSEFQIDSMVREF